MNAWNIALMILGVCLVPAPAHAQVPAEDRSTGPEPARVHVERDSGGTIRGRLVHLGNERITMLVDGSRIELPLASVTRIRTAPDSIANGVVIGALVAGLWCALVCGQGLDRAEDLPKAALAAAAQGAAIGACIDAAHPNRVTLYEQPQASASRMGRPMLAIRVRF